MEEYLSMNHGRIEEIILKNTMLSEDDIMFTIKSRFCLLIETQDKQVFFEMRFVSGQFVFVISYNDNDERFDNIEPAIMKVCEYIRG